MASTLMGKMMEAVANGNTSSNYNYKETTEENCPNKFTLDLNINLHVYHHNSNESTKEQITI